MPLWTIGSDSAVTTMWLWSSSNAPGAATAHACRKHWVSSATFYKSEGKVPAASVSEAKRLRGLEDENRRLKKLVAETMLDNAMLKGIATKNGDPAARRKAVAHLYKAREVSQQGVSLPVRPGPRPRSRAMRRKSRRRLRDPGCRQCRAAKILLTG
jgi:putative transposase